MSGKQSEIWTSDEEGVAHAVQRLREGGLVALPTETVYGLAARGDSAEAVAAIYRTKGRPDFNPLIVHVADIDMAKSIARFDARAEALAARFWPGPLTLVLPLIEGAAIAPAVTAGLSTIALRQPAHPLARRVLEKLHLPLAAPSANRSNGVSPTSAAHVLQSLGDRAPPVLDGGSCQAGLESTIIALRRNGEWSLLRPGPVTAADLQSVLGKPATDARKSIEAPGQLEKHYSPGKPVRLDAKTAVDDEFHIGFGEIFGEISLSRTADLADAAARLYACLHEAAASEKARIAIAPVPQEGMGAAINDRLSRAAA